MDPEEVLENDVTGLSDEELEEEEEEEEQLALPHDDDLNTPIPPNFREISTLASWTVSSSKPGCSIPQLRNPSTNLFWQSDGPQPHWLNIHFFKLVRIVGLRLYLDFNLDESYTPTRIVFLAGSGGNDLVEWGEMRLEQPRGWIWADFSGVGDTDSESDSGEELNGEDAVIQHLAEALEDDGSDFENNRPRVGAEGVGLGAGNGEPMVVDQTTPILQHQQQQQQTPNSTLLRNHPRRALQNLTPNASPAIPQRKEKRAKVPTLKAHLVQIRILENHQNGKDTHLRGLQIFARDDERGGDGSHRKPVVTLSQAKDDSRRKSRKSEKGSSRFRGLGRSQWDAEPTIR
ncbi:galactose-binding like protein [Lojkania enalia]|uniref:Galactose-binding like protein n=1 Tax=Lojkania enalia TaxID=147567 RepID=A0A9P4N8J8_9PLEO|nr:galactose-binding like protein [Didymosphaeria enalia]